MKPLSKSKGKTRSLQVILIILMWLGIFISGAFFLLALIFHFAINLSNFWHLTLVSYTLCMPILSFVGTLYFCASPKSRSLLFSVVPILGNFLTPLLWNLDASSGIIH
ncbi:hypothetical protein [Rubritalea sp.]|uniref:hypothetical protein n=1 Tax=Rubritalea sp. TaxID=2109375 RepID=UPI003EF90AAF